jgi:hypothetical protein
LLARWRENGGGWNWCEFNVHGYDFEILSDGNRE